MVSKFPSRVNRPRPMADAALLEVPMLGYRELFKGRRLRWPVRTVERVKRWWAEGMALAVMARRLNKDPDDVALLLFDLALTDEIQPRPGGCFGDSHRPEARR